MQRSSKTEHLGRAEIVEGPTAARMHRLSASAPAAPAASSWRGRVLELLLRRQQADSATELRAALEAGQLPR